MTVVPENNRNISHQQTPRKRNRIWPDILIGFLLILTLLGGAYLRLVGLNWDENQHMHPDERFLSLVQVAIAPVDESAGYFDTDNSPLNPANRGYPFFVYGTLPIFIIRYLGEWTGQTGYHEITLLGRQVSALFDLITVLLVFLIGRRLYNKWTGLLGAAFYSLAVLPIQLSHFMTVDTITNTFAYLAVFAAVWALRRTRDVEVPPTGEEAEPGEAESNDTVASTASAGKRLDLVRFGRILKDLGPYILFGVALGAATASKINAVVLAMVLPLVELVRYVRMDPAARKAALLPILRNLVVGGVVSFLVFRLGQPYAFQGPGFFNLDINETWWTSLQNLRAQASGQVDFPPALQWARRPITFSWQNLVTWGLGLPLGLFSWLAYLGMGWMILSKKKWHRHLPLWAFTGLYFAWQSFSWVRSMRYQMLIYPALVLFAGWGLVRLWRARKPLRLRLFHLNPVVIRVTGIVLTIGILLSTAAWAFAFTRIYTRPHTRVAASRWIYQNIPGALTLQMDTDDGDFQQPLPYRAGDSFDGASPYALPFYGIADGVLSSVTFPHILDEFNTDALEGVTLSIISAESPETVLGSVLVTDSFQPDDEHWQGRPFEFLLETPVALSEGDLYYLRLDLVEGETSLSLRGSPVLHIVTAQGMALKHPLPRIQQSVRAGADYLMNVTVLETGTITEVTVPYLVDQAGAAGEKTLQLRLKLPDTESVAGPEISTTLAGDFSPNEDARGGSYTFVLDQPLPVTENDVLLVTLSTDRPDVRLVLHAPAPVHESSWDDAIPYPVDGFSPYSEDGGIYRGDLNFEMYWNDEAFKLEKFETNLDQADYIFITSNRQWGTTTRVPERYLLTTFYYRNLLGCPPEEDILWCYSVAEPGMFEGNLGFELVEVEASYPNLGPVRFNSQFAEEAFTVYDHPKVLIFQKTDAYDPVAVRELLRTVDLSRVVYFTPGQADDYQGPDPDQLYEPRYNLMLPPERLEEQRQGGTWSQLFDTDALINTSQPAAVIGLYLFVTLLGLLSYPLVRMALPGLDDRGYPLARLAGMLLLALLVWILGSLGISFSRTTILIVLGFLALLSGGLFLIQRKKIWADIQANWAYYLIVEVLALAAFLGFLLVRMENPDLWHPYKGGEKPMDFSYLNAVLKSTTFPPYDPWFSGGYINYYYYGFVIVGVPIKLLGIVPAVAYNIVLPIWYSILILSAFSVGWNLYRGIPRSRALSPPSGSPRPVLGMAFWVGLATAIGLAVLGNLGTVRLIINGYQRLASGGVPLEDATFGQQITWTLQGFVQFLKGAPMPFYPGDWYWFPSRVIPGEPITEFPFFTFIYGDLHAHLIAFPITVFGISWSLSVVLSGARWVAADGRFKWLRRVSGFFLGAIVIGALRPTNTWDFYTYLVLASISLLYSILRHHQPRLKIPRVPDLAVKIAVALAAILVLAFLSMLLYQPFSYWFGQGYTSVDFWKGDRTPLNSYFTHWGLFLFLIVSWMAWETYHWMKTTPASALKKLAPYKNWIYTGLILTLILQAVFLILGAPVALVAVPIGLWAVLLMLRPGQSDGRRFLLFLIGTSVFLTLVVEFIYLPGDIGRMNTVFKFYLQVWIMLGISAGVCLGWLVKSFRYWNNRLEFVWQALFFMLVCSAALFTLMGTTDKIRDRMAPEAPQTLDGMAFMQHATYYDMGFNMKLEQDYNGIRWMQENIQGSPVILEGQAYEYRWGNRYTIYTGLPGVVGWNWHQRQQRAILRTNIVQERVDAVGLFYTTEDKAYVVDFIEDYDVRYIVFGQLERAFFPGPGLAKFEAYEGELWEEVFRDGSTLIYRVLD
jgi:YYY domain-containing protein